MVRHVPKSGTYILVGGNCKKMTKTPFYILTLILAINFSFGQKLDRKAELEKIFLQLPIDTNLTELIQAAKSAPTLKSYNDTLIEEPDYFTGYLTKNSQFEIQPKNYQFEIFTTSIDGVVGVSEPIDSILIIAIYANYGDTLTKEVKKQYLKFVNTFKKKSQRAEKYTVHAEPGQIGEGYKFFRTENDRFQYLTISLMYGDCTSKSYSIHISYNRTDKWN